MRSLALMTATVAVVLVLTSRVPSVRAQARLRPPATAACSFDGLWIARASGFTTRIAGGRWQTWSGTMIDERTRPQGAGWLEITRDRLTFDFDDGRTGYPYAFAWEDGCDLLHLTGSADLRFERTVRTTQAR